ncbi:MAG TPA: TRAM domain-containing protein, partial [Fredinandcohnia sp.]|nr:TRAM domain-containing protein [Fredinandcohnia sp.]
VGRSVEVLVEGPSRYDPTRRFGRTPENRVVNFDGDAPVGAIVRVRIDEATPNSLSGVQEGYAAPRPPAARLPLAVVR